MIYVGIDVAKDKHDCYICNSDGETLIKPFKTILKDLIYAGMSPSFNESGERENRHAYMEKRGSGYLRYALYNATKYVCKWNKTFKAYFYKKLAEGKPYNVAISHAAKKLVRTIYALEMSHKTYTPAH